MTQFRHKRSLVNYIIKPAFQLRYGFYFLAFGVAASLVVQWLSYVSLRDAIIDFHVNKKDGDLMSWLDPSMIAIGEDYLYFLIGFGLLCFTFGIWITHKIVGPSVALKRFIKELRQGKYGHSIRLRDGDHLQDVAEDLNELSRILAEKHHERKVSFEVIENEELQKPEKEETNKKRA